MLRRKVRRWRPRIVAFVGVTLFRAVFESMARNHEVCARRLDREGRAERIVFSGGVARRNRILRELTAEALALPHRLSPHTEDTLFGLMVLARAFSGRDRITGSQLLRN